MKVCSFFVFLAALICFNIKTKANEHREHKAHVHGKAKLEIEIEKDEIEADLEISGMDLVGFEGKPTTDKQKKTLEKVTKTFTTDYNLFLISEDAGCVVKERKLDKDQDTKGDHHTEFEFTIKYQCKDISKVKVLDANLFRDIDTLKEVNVEVATEKNQKELKIYPTKSKIEL